MLANLNYAAINSLTRISRPIAAQTPAAISSASMPQPLGSLSSLRIGHGLAISATLNNRKPTVVTSQACPTVKCSMPNHGTPTNATACPASSSATTSRGSFSPLRAITPGANITHTIEPAKATTTITVATSKAETLTWHNRPKATAGGSEPHVPGATGSHPRPKHDVSSLLMVAET